MHPVPLFCAESARHETAHRLSERFDLSPVRKRPESGYWLELGPDKLELLTTGKHGSVFAEFVEGAARHRRQQGGGRGQPVARAIGLKSGASLPHVVDATAGLGRDAFVLATLGCQVTLIERSPVAAALLYDALERASVDVDTMEIAARMTLVHADAITWLNQQQGEHQPDVVYVDPMFPDTGKSAAAKKDMQAFQQVIGDDLDCSWPLSGPPATVSWSNARDWAPSLRGSRHQYRWKARARVLTSIRSRLCARPASWST